MMTYLLEHIVPREYYTNMISLTADVNILLLILSIYKTKCFKHLRKYNFELPMVLVELFITVFTTNQTTITELIMDMVLIEGSIVFFKVMLLFFQYFEKEIFKLSEFCRPNLTQSTFYSSSKASSVKTLSIPSNSSLTSPKFTFRSFSSTNSETITQNKNA